MTTHTAGVSGIEDEIARLSYSVPAQPELYGHRNSLIDGLKRALTILAEKDSPRRSIACPGNLYSGSTLIIHRVADKDYYGDASAVCDYCMQRVKLQGRRMTSHRLDVTIHGVTYA